MRSYAEEIYTGRTSTAKISHEEVLAVKIARREVLGVVLTKDQGWSFAKRTPRGRSLGRSLPKVHGVVLGQGGPRVIRARGETRRAGLKCATWDRIKGKNG